MLEVAWKDALRALELDADSVDAVILAVDLSLITNRTQEVREYVANAVVENPNAPVFYLCAAKIELPADRQLAIQRLKEGLDRNPGHAVLLWNVGRLALDQGDLEEVNRVVTELRAYEQSAAAVAFLEAGVLKSQQKWREAIELIEDSRALFAADDELQVLAESVLATCYQALGNVDQQLKALRRVHRNNPQQQSGRLALAAALRRAGRLEEATAEYWHLVKQSDPPLEAVVNLARLLLDDAVRLEESDRDWTSFTELLTLLRQLPGGADELAILQAEQAVAQGDSVRALEQLQERIEQAPNRLRLRQALIAVHARMGDWDQAEAELLAAVEALGDSPQLRLEQATLRIRRDQQAAADDQWSLLAAPPTDWTETQKLELARGFARLFLALGEYERCHQQTLLLINPDHDRTVLADYALAFELAFRTGDRALLERSVQSVKEIEGTGPLWRFGEAVRLIANAEKPGDPSASQALYSEAMAHLNEAGIARPSWSRIPWLQGQIYRLTGRTDLAAERFLKALALGQTDSETVVQTIHFLSRQGRDAEADRLVYRLQGERVTLSVDVLRTASQVAAKLERYDRAIELTQEWADESQSREDRLWLAQLYRMAGRQVEAEQRFQQLIETDPASPAAWIALIQMHLRSGKVDLAREVLAAARTAIEDEGSAAVLARCYELTGDDEQAAELYRRALDLTPEDAPLMQQFAEYCMRVGDQVAAQGWLERLADSEHPLPAADQAWARRKLALVLASQGGEERFRRARSLLEANLEQSGSNAADQQALAAILGSHSDRQSVLEAISILENLVQTQTPVSLDDQFLLAECFLRIEDWTNYSRTMRSVLGSGGANEEKYVRRYVEVLVARGELLEAPLWVDRLKVLAPNKSSTATIESGMWFAAGQFDQLLGLLASRASQPASLLWSAQAAEVFGTRLENREDHQQATRFFDHADRCFQEISDQDGRSQWEYAKFCARRGDLDKTIALIADGDCDAANLAEVARAALGSKGLRAAEIKPLIPLLDSVPPNDHPIEIARAKGDIYAWLGDAANAMTAYRRALDQDPNNVVVLNNLAAVLAMTRQHLESAKEAIDLAISESETAHHVLLDTRGSVHLAMGNASAAVADFRTAAQLSPDSEHFFHLAVALVETRAAGEARGALRQALQRGATRETIHPLERNVFDTLIKELQPTES